MPAAGSRSLQVVMGFCLFCATWRLPAAWGQAQQSGSQGVVKIMELSDQSTSRPTTPAETALARIPIDYEAEKTIGAALAVEAFERFGGPYHNAALLHYVTLVGLGVATHTARNHIPYYFAILDDPSPNALSTPGGYVFVTIGLLQQLRSEAELAGVLGHEIAHIGQKHLLQMLQQSGVLQGLSQVTITTLEHDPELFTRVLHALAEVVFDHGLDPNLEYEADLLGAMYAARVGYQPIGLAHFLRRLAVPTDHRVRGWLKTHPDPGTRAARLQQSYGEVARGQELAQRFTEAMAFQERVLTEPCQP
jgi:predicted Zn-dependent protease